ncbi:hypothetical protein BH23ACT10_BH23ACT10_36940 [soil metagenome]
MLHPYSIFFKALWDESAPHRHPHDDDPVPERGRRFRWSPWWRYAAQRRVAAEQADRDQVNVPVMPNPWQAPRGGIDI